MLLQVLGGRFSPPSNSWFKMLLQVLGESFSPMKSKQLSYCKFWGAFKINGSDAIASFGGIFLPPSYSRFKFQIQKAIASFRGNFCKFWGARKIKAFRPIASFGGEFSPPSNSWFKKLLQVLGENFHPHQIPDLKSYCKFWGRIFTPIKFLI